MNLGEPMSSREEGCNKSMNGKEQPEIGHWQSDYPIVSEKSMKVDGEKGTAAVRCEARDTPARHRTGQQVSTKLASLTSRARRKPKGKFNSLMHLLTEEFLMGCYRELKRDKSPGIDGMRMEEYGDNLEDNIRGLVGRLKARRYRSQPVKRVYIPKTDGTRRGLGIPTIEDKVVQMGIKKILEAIYEVDFMGVSYGFRPHRSSHDALDAVNEAIMAKPINAVVDMDIRKYFDTIDHRWMMKMLRERVTDTSLLKLIGKFLRAGVMEEGRVEETDKGTPQGGVLSPLLANIYLHYVLDLWFERKVKKQLRGYAQLIRYADDFIVCFQAKKEAEEFGEELRQRLSRFGLEVAEDKSRIIEFGRYEKKKAQREGRKVATFNFLGITHYCATGKAGKFKLGRSTERARYWRKMEGMNQWLKGVRSTVELRELWQTLRQKLVGHYRYYGIGGNSRKVSAFYHETVKLVYKWINRRSQKRSYNWEQFQRLLKYNPLPKPKIYHPYPVVSARMHC